MQKYLNKKYLADGLIFSGMLVNVAVIETLSEQIDLLENEVSVKANAGFIGVKRSGRN